MDTLAKQSRHHKKRGPAAGVHALAKHRSRIRPSRITANVVARVGLIQSRLVAVPTLRNGKRVRRIPVRRIGTVTDIVRLPLPGVTIRWFHQQSSHHGKRRAIHVLNRGGAMKRYWFDVGPLDVIFPRSLSPPAAPHGTSGAQSRGG